MFVYSYENTTVPKDVKKVIIDPSVSYIKVNAFEQCTTLTTITIPPSVTHIGDSAFVGCTSLIAVNFPSSTLKYIGDQAFTGCKSLIYFDIPSSVNFIGDHSFYGCDSLLSVITTYREIFDLVKNRFGKDPHLRLHRVCSSMDVNLEGIQDTMRQLNLNHCEGVVNLDDTTCNGTDQSKQLEASMITTDLWGLTPLHVICSNSNATSKMIQLITDHLPLQATMMKTVSNGKTPLELYKLCKQESTYDLSLHPALKLGMKWVDVRKMLEEDKTLDSLEQGMVDETTGFYPFMLAAVHPMCDLECLYRLACYNVDNVEPH